MFSTPMTLLDRAGANQSFSRLSSDADKSRWLNSASTLSAPHTMEVKHTISKPGVNSSDRSLLSLQKVVLDSVSVPRSATVNLTIARDRTGVTSNDLRDLLAEVISFFTTGAITLDETAIAAFLNGES